MANTDISTRDNGADLSVAIRTFARAGISYVPPVPYADYVNPLMRVSLSYAPATLDPFGRPIGGTLLQTGETIEPWARIAVTIDNHDVTFFRDLPTAIDSISWQRLGHYETLSLTIPGASVFEPHGTGDLNWLTDNATVKIIAITEAGARNVIWAGSINAIQPGQDGTGLSITAHGLLYDGTYRLAKAPVKSSESTVIQDLGTDIAKALNAAPGKWSYCEPVVTGATDAKEGNNETLLDYVRSLLSFAVTDSGDSWTVWMNDAGKPSIVKTKEIPGATTVTLAAGQAGVNDGLTRDTTTGTNIIYGTGITKWGAEWRNTIYPVATASKPRYPLDDPSATFGNGSSDRVTVTGTGVTLLQTKLLAKGYSVRVTGKYDDRTSKAVTAFQKKYSIHATGNVNIATWSKLVGVKDMSKGAYQQPLAIDRSVQERTYNTYGVDTGANPYYNPTARKIEQHIDFGQGVSLAQAAKAARGLLARNGITNMFSLGTAVTGSTSSQPLIEGDLTLTACPPEKARWDIQPGDTINYTDRWGQDLQLLVHRVSWNLNELSVSLTVSTRDMDYDELDAALNRIRTSQLAGKKRSGALAAGIGSDFGSEAANPALFDEWSTNSIYGYNMGQGARAYWSTYIELSRATRSTVANKIAMNIKTAPYTIANVRVAVYRNIEGTMADRDRPGVKVKEIAATNVSMTSQGWLWFVADEPFQIEKGDWFALWFNTSQNVDYLGYQLPSYLANLDTATPRGFSQVVSTSYGSATWAAAGLPADFTGQPDSIYTTTTAGTTRGYVALIAMP